VAPNPLQHRLRVIEDLLVGKSEHFQAILRKESIPLSVGFLLVGVHRTVHFHHQRPIPTIEIDDESAYRVLASEFPPVQASFAQ